MIGDVHGQR